MSARRIVFTKNNWTREDKESLLSDPKFSYVIVGEEISSTGTPHLQGYAEFEKPTKWAPLAKKYKMFCEIAVTQSQAIEYCKKGGNFEERGTLRDGSASGGQHGHLGGQKEKDRWEAARASAKAGKLDDIPADIYFRYYRVAKEIAKDHMVAPQPLATLNNLWICGEAGTGKTRLADIILPGAYSKNCNKWWDGYQNESGVIINDFGKEHHVLGHHLKLWSEHRPFIAETKGGSLHIRPARTIVTSQYSVEQIWEDFETRDAIKRRFKVVHLTGTFTYEDLVKLSTLY